MVGWACKCLDMVCGAVAKFRLSKKKFGRIAINLSGAQFSDDGLLDELKQVIDFWEISSSDLEFEITESMVMNNHEQAIAHMDGLRPPDTPCRLMILVLVIRP